MKYSRETLQSYMAGSLSVLALWQTWAIFTVAPDPAHDGNPAKRHETRHWYPRGIGLPFNVAIHAAKRFDGTTRHAYEEPRFREALKRAGYYPGDPRPFLDRKMTPPGDMKAVPLGAIVGLASVVAILTPQTVSMQAGLDGVRALELESLTDDDRAFGYYEPNAADPHKTRYAWRLDKPVLLPEPIVHTGRQDALYPVDVETRDAINQQLRWMEMEAA